MITINDLNTRYKNFELSIDKLMIKSGKITFLLGDNGAGKTTFVKCLLNLKNYSGQIRYMDKGFYEVRKIVSAVFSDGGLYSNLTGYENSKYFNSGVKSELFKLEHDLMKREVGKYSTGEYKKLATNISFQKEIDYLICDEISSGLDYESTKQLKDYLKDYRNNGCSILLTGHQFDFYNDIIDDIIIMKKGRIVYSGPINDIVNQIGCEAELRIEKNVKLFEDMLFKDYGAKIQNDIITVMFRDIDEYKMFKNKYIKYILSIDVNRNKVGIVYEKFFK